MIQNTCKAVAGALVVAGAMSAQAQVLDFEAFSPGPSGSFLGNVSVSPGGIYAGWVFGTGATNASNNDFAVFPAVTSVFNQGVGDSKFLYTSNCFSAVAHTALGTTIPACSFDANGFELPAPARDSQPITIATPVKLNSVFLSGNGPSDVPQDVTFKLFDASDILVGTETFNVGSLNPGLAPIAVQYTFTTASFISKIVINGQHSYFAIDNLDVTPIPEPGTYALMLVGLAAVAGVARRRSTR